MRRELFVGNLAFTVNDEILKAAFSDAGAVESAKVIMDRASGRSKGFGFVTMQTVEAAEVAVNKLNNKDVEGRAIRVSFSNSDEQRSSRPRPSGPGGGGNRSGGNGGGNGGGFQRRSFGSRD